MDLKQSCGANRVEANNAVKHVKVEVCKTQTLKDGCQTLVHIVAPMTACSICDSCRVQWLKSLNKQGQKRASPTFNRPFAVGMCGGRYGVDLRNLMQSGF